jgi:hypothetical protein
MVRVVKVREHDRIVGRDKETSESAYLVTNDNAGFWSMGVKEDKIRLYRLRK